MKYIKNINQFLESISSNDNLEFMSDFSKFKKIIDSSIDDYDLTNFDEIISILMRDCGAFINEIKNSKSLVFRGFKNVDALEQPTEGLYKVNTTRGRTPLDMDPGVSDDFDDVFSDLYNFRMRYDGVFTTKNPMSACEYSSFNTIQKSVLKRRVSFIFFPIGDYEYFWNPSINDLFGTIEMSDWYQSTLDINTGYFDDDKDLLEKVKRMKDVDIRNLASGYKSTGIDNAITQEIVFNCDSYYLLDEHYFYKILEYLSK
jgi:hypothetical protein